jgi:hypothetical protein
MWKGLSAACLLLAGCASSAGDEAANSGAPEPQPQIWAVGEYLREGRISNVQPGVDRVSVDLEAPPDASWEALVQVYQDIGIEIAGADPRIRSLNNPEFTVSRRLGGERLSKYLTCGSGLTGAFADRFRVQMNILSQITAAEDGKSVVHTTIQAVGNNPEGVSNTRVPCSSTHQLEYRIAQEVAKLAKG